MRLRQFGNSGIDTSCTSSQIYQVPRRSKDDAPQVASTATDKGTRDPGDSVAARVDWEAENNAGSSESLLIAVGRGVVDSSKSCYLARAASCTLVVSASR